MELSEVYTFLRQVKNDEWRIKRLMNKRNRLFSIMTGHGIVYDRDKVQSSPRNEMPEIWAEICDIDKEIAHTKKQQAAAVTEISDTLELLEPIESTILSDYYVDCKKMESIAKEVGYSERQAWRYARKGVLHLRDVLEKDVSECQ